MYRGVSLMRSSLLLLLLLLLLLFIALHREPSGVYSTHTGTVSYTRGVVQSDCRVILVCLFV